MSLAQKKIILAYLIFQTCFAFLVWIPIFYEVQRQLGLTNDQIYSIQSIYYIAFCFLELPTGFLADKWGHQTVLKIAAFTLFVANGVPIFFSSFIGFLAHFLLIAVARSLASGSASAYLYEYCLENKLGNEFKKIEGKARSYSLWARVLVWPLAGFLLSINYKIPYIFSALAGILALGSCFLFSKNLVLKKDENKRNSYIQRITSEISYNPIILIYMIQGAGIFVLQRICLLQLFNPLLSSKNISIEYFGLILSGITLFESWGALKGYRYFKNISNESLIFYLSIILIVLLFIMKETSPYLTILALSCFSFILGVAYPVQKQLINDQVRDGSLRASFLSLESLIDRMICSGVSFFIAKELQGYQVKGLLWTISVGPLLVFVFLMPLKYYFKKSFSKTMVFSK